MILLLLPARLILLSKVTPTRPDETDEYTFYILQYHNIRVERRL